MALITHDLFGQRVDKVERAINILRTFHGEEPYFLAYSGGKDSIVADALLQMSGAPYEKHYSVTTVDPPELVRFIIGQHDHVTYCYPDGRKETYTTHYPGKLLHPCDPKEAKIGNHIYFDIPLETMRQLIIRKGTPPSRIMRYCCEKLKESSGVGCVTVTGVRWAESQNRKQNQGLITIFDGKAGSRAATEQGVNFTQTARGGYSQSG